MMLPAAFLLLHGTGSMHVHHNVTRPVYASISLHGKPEQIIELPALSAVYSEARRDSMQGPVQTCNVPISLPTLLAYKGLGIKQVRYGPL